MKLQAASILACSILAVGCGGEGDTSSAPSAPPPAVEAVKARKGALPLVERLSGIARAADQVELRPEIAGIVEEVLVRSGDAVRKGQPLVRLRGDIPREQVAQAEASLQVTEARLDELRAQVVRTRALAEQQLVSALELETREAQLLAAEAATAQARATVDERRAASDRSVVRAPIAGHVGRRLVEPGARVDSDTLLFVLGNLDRLVVEVPLTEGMLAYLHEGDPVRMTARALGDTVLEGRLTRVPPFLAVGSFSTVGEIDVTGPSELKPGMFVQVDVLHGLSREATLVPVGALWDDPRTGERTVWVVKPDPALEGASELSAKALPVERRVVDVVAEGREAVGVEGVAEGEWVVTVGQQLLSGDGAVEARVRPATWERVEALQSLQREDLLERFLAKQRRVARERGATPPPSADYVRPAS